MLLKKNPSKPRMSRFFQVEEPKSSFKFGDAPSVKSIENVTFPCYILGRRTTLSADVVDRNIPLLISKEEMKKRRFTINFQTDQLVVDGKEYDLSTTSKGHLKLPLWSEEECNICFDDMNEEEKVSTITKLLFAYHYGFVVKKKYI